MLRLLIAASVPVIVLAAAAPAPGYKEWNHAPAMGMRSCAVGCHAEQTPTNATCTGCHAGFRTPGTQKCWACHEPGADTTAWQLAAGCTTTCHLLTTTGDDEPNYTTSYAHTRSAHLGAAGYGKTCVDCHGVGSGATTPGTSPHHDAVDSSAPGCAGCHDGGVASAPTGHASFGAVCTSCHTGMDRPSGECSACHIGRVDTAIPQITYANTLACADAGCHGKVVNHGATPISAAPCTTCHAAHYGALGTCASCHPDPTTFHHGTATARPLADCAGCHDGGIAPAKPSHATIACSLCHSDMGRPPVPGVCSRCHLTKKFGTATCTACHSPTGMIGREQVHDAAPGAGVSCTTCHGVHHADLGTCQTCHGLVPQVHHGVIAPASSVLVVQASPARVAAGAAAVVSGGLSDAGGAPLAGLEILLQARRLSTETFTDVVTLTTGADGSFSHPVRPAAGTEYRVVYKGAASVSAVQRPAIARASITVKQTVRLAARPKSVRRGASVRLSGSVAPTAQQLAAAASALLLRVERRTSSGWRKVAGHTIAARNDGAFTWSLRMRRAGVYRAKATAAATPDLLAGASAWVRLRVR